MLDQEETDPILPIREVTAFEPSVTLPLTGSYESTENYGKTGSLQDTHGIRDLLCDWFHDWWRSNSPGIQLRDRHLHPRIRELVLVGSSGRNSRTTGYGIC